MRTNIIKTEMDTQRLNVMINKYENENPDKPYLIMNKKTAESLAEAFDCNIPCPLQNGNLNKRDIVGMYEGYKIYIDEDVQFGDVEIR